MDDTAWHNIVAWRGLATLAQQYISKGTQLFVIGHLSYRKYTDNTGVERTITEIIADKIELCGARSESVSAPVAGNDYPKTQPKTSLDEIGDLPPDDGMPF